MRVILLQDVRGVGKKSDIKDVSDGYAKNFLLARHLATVATADRVKVTEDKKARAANDQVEITKRLGVLARELGSRRLEFPVKTDETGAVFGSITKEMILTAMRSHGWLGPERVDILLEHPLKKIGEHVVSVDLKHGLTAQLTVTLRPQQ